MQYAAYGEGAQNADLATTLHNLAIVKAKREQAAVKGCAVC